MNSHSTSGTQRSRITLQRSARASLAALGLLGLGSSVFAADKPPLAPDTAAPFTTDSRISASIEFGLPALASEIEKDIPRRLASIDERVSCVHRRVLFFRVNANCDVRGYVERSGPVSLYGRGDRVYGSVPIFGVLEGQGLHQTFGVDATPRLIVLDGAGVLRGATTGWGIQTAREISDEISRCMPK